MSEGTRPTIEMIATEVGVSVSTVSRALRGDHRISAKTTEAIRAEAKRVGYRPNPLISALMSQLRDSSTPRFQSTIAYLETSPDPPHTQTWPSSQQHYSAVHDRAVRLGYGIDHFWFHDPQISHQHLVRILVSRGIQGVIIHYLPTPKNRLHELPLDLSPFAVAALGSKLDAPSLHYSSSDHYSIMNLALDQLQRLGYRRIGLAMDLYVDNIVEGRFLGAYLTWQQSIPVKDRLRHFVTDDFSQARFAAWFSAVKPEAVICIDDQVLTWLRAMKIPVPDRVGVVHLDPAQEQAEITGVRQRHDAVGASAVDLIIGQLHRNERGIPEVPKAVLIEGEWVPGKTVQQRTASTSMAGAR